MRDSCWRGRLLCLVSALAWLSLAIATGCTPAPRPPRLVVLYAPCTVNKDYLAPYAEQVTYTPHLARFARDSAVFTRHYTEAGQSGIAYASIFSGGQADHHKAFRHPVHLPDELNLAAEIFADAGYETFFWNGHRMASHELGYGQGVDRSNAFRRMENAPQQAQRRGALLGPIRASRRSCASSPGTPTTRPS